MASRYDDGMVPDGLWPDEHARSGRGRPAVLTPQPLIGVAEHGGEQGFFLERSHAMTDRVPQPPLPPLGDHRPMRTDVAPTEIAGATTGLLQLDHRPMHIDEAPTEGADATAALSLQPTDPASAPASTTRYPMRTTTSVVAACGAHLLVLFALISVPTPEYGSGGSGHDAISVSIIPATALVAREPTSDTSARSALAQIAPETGEDVVESTAARAESSRPSDEARERPADERAEPEERLAAPAEQAPEVVREEAPKLTGPPTPPEEAKVATVEPPPTPDPPKKKDEPPPENEPARPVPEARTAGGETSIGSAADQSPQTAAASASHGQLFDYGLAVQAALLAVDQREAKALLSASRAKGTVVVKLVLDRSGTLARAEVVKSSGNPRLDEVALLLTRRAAFPPPPSALVTAELSYIAPVRFR
jgi:periplasmic protein TonB